MAITTRQTSLLVAEDWTKVYQSFRNADFQSYDYETLRATMINYLQLYYPEDFNDYIESSEFIALIDMIAFLGQSLAFRADLNARENFIDTAQRRDSILKLARLISYNAKRNSNSRGFLKFDSVSTTENLFDSNGINLSGLVINWEDAANDNWLEQFTIIINSALQNNQVIGKPASSATLNGIVNEIYQINYIPNTLSISPFRAAVAGTQMTFEAVSPIVDRTNIIQEAPPFVSAPFNFVYKNDGLGFGSPNTGFFLYFVQGTLQSLDFNFTDSVPNRVLSINNGNINNTDVWVYSVDANGNLDTLWEQVPAVANTNVVYNNSINRKIYQVNTRTGDQIDLVFGDGTFAEIPIGRYRVYFRTSNGLQYKITPEEMQGIVFSIQYISQAGRVESLNITASLTYTIANATTRESLDDIKQKAPQQFYTQNRMITGEDYNILPYTLFNSILKVKAVNRSSSGVSRYLDVVDATGKYSSTNIFGQDGILFRDDFTTTFNFDYATTNDIFRVIYNRIIPIVQSIETKQFFYAFYPLIPLLDPDVPFNWVTSTLIANGCTGYFVNGQGRPLQVGPGTSASVQYIQEGAIIRFKAGDNKYFDSQNFVRDGVPSKPGDKYYVYATVQLLVGDGSNNGQGNLPNGKGPVTINQVLPENQSVVADQIFAVFNIDLTSELINTMVNYISAFSNFGLRYDLESGSWRIIPSGDLNLNGPFSLTYAGDASGQARDSSWIIAFQTAGKTYKVSYRGTNYIFESVKETNFYFDEKVKIFDPKTGQTINDQIKVLKINAEADTSLPLGLDYVWQVYEPIVEVDGYSNVNRIKVTFSDSDADGVPDNPEIFDMIVNPAVNFEQKYIYFKYSIGYDSFIAETPIDKNTVVSTLSNLRQIEQEKTLYQNGQIFYIPESDEFYQLNVVGAAYTLVKTTDYVAKVGRQDLFFQYKHHSPNNRRIDPSPNNIIDLYILTQQYATDYLAWVRDTSGLVLEPFAPTGEELQSTYSNLENFKAISDTVIYNPARFKPLFGTKADPSLQANFKVVKNPNVVVSDSEIKTSVIAAINQFFDIANWDFGDTFYFSELAAFLHVQLSPNISSVIITPANETEVFGSLMQVNCNINEIMTSAATVDNVQIISAITAAQINQTGRLVVN